MQILAVILYGKNGKRRILPFGQGRVNIITGQSNTGKSTVGNIIDYCFGGTSCPIAEGFVRDHVAYYALHIVHNNECMFIARENPPSSHSSTNKCYYIIGATEIPDDLTTATPIDNESLEKILSAKLGISENMFVPPVAQSRPRLSANIRHTLYYCIQNQDEIASQKIVFHRQSEPFIPQTIKDTLPFFLGIINEDSLALESEQTKLKREAVILRRSIEEVESLKGNGLHRATALLTEAKEIGLIQNDTNVDMSDYNSVKRALETAFQWTPIDIAVSGMDRVSLLQSELVKTQQDIDDISIDIRNTEEFLGQVRGYNAEVAHQQKRLESIGLFEQIEFDSKHCPFCSTQIESPHPSVGAMRNAIVLLKNKLSSVSRERPHLRKHADELIERRQRYSMRVKEIQIEINAVYEENKEAIRLKDLNARRGRVLGRISLWLESVVESDDFGSKKIKLNEIEARIAEIHAILGTDEIDERKQSAISRISSMMSAWAKDLRLEHHEYPYRFDLNKLTVVADRDRPIPLPQLGGASNWLRCHLITLFALHTFFKQNNRPVPEFLFIDQPSQVYFPSETNREDVDSQEVRAVYKFIFDRVAEMNPNMQVIIVDHADINEEYFQEAVVEKWWDDTKLVPIDWNEDFVFDD